MATTTSKIKDALLKMVNDPKNKAGLTFGQVWDELERSDFKDELYDKNGKKRLGTLVGLTSRVQNGKVEGLQVIKQGSTRLYISDRSSIDFLVGLTTQYLQKFDEFKIDPADLTSKQAEELKKLRKTVDNLRANILSLTLLAEDAPEDANEEPKVADTIGKNTTQAKIVPSSSAKGSTPKNAPTEKPAQNKGKTTIEEPKAQTKK